MSKFNSKVRGRVKEAKMIIEVAIGEDYPGDGAHKMCTDLSPNCFKPRTATTFLTLLETGLYDGRPASKVLLIPKTGMYFEKKTTKTK